jgi:uncharacterized protein (TIGR02117 family)
MKSGNLIYRLLIILILSLSFKLTIGFIAAFTQSDSNAEKIKTGESIEFFVLQAGWHTGIVLRTKDVSPADWPEVVNYQRYTFVDIGWGDEQFYQDEGNSPALALRAALIPTSSVIHIVPFNVHPLKLYGSETFLKRIEATSAEFSALCRIISSSFKRDKNGNLIKSQINKNPSGFFEAKGKYHIFNTCNTWVVRCLKEAGYNVSPGGVITQQQLIKALENLPGKAWESSNER